MYWTLSQFDILAQLAADSAGWTDGADYPSTVLCRRILALADWAAAHPECWRASRLAFECPELLQDELCAALDMDACELRRALRDADLSDPFDRAALASPLYDEPPAHLFPPQAQYRPERISATYSNGTWLAVYAAGHPSHWQVWRLRWNGMTQQEIAGRIGISQKTVCIHLQTPIRFKRVPPAGEWSAGADALSPPMNSRT